MSHRKPTKLQFIDLWRDEASCNFIVKVDKSMETAWDNIDVGTWQKTITEPDPKADIAKILCFDCPVRELCLRDAVNDNEAEGIRGGYRFENGTVSRSDARKIFHEWGIRTKVSKKARDKSEDVIESEEVPEVREND